MLRTFCRDKMPSHELPCLGDANINALQSCQPLMKTPSPAGNKLYSETPVLCSTSLSKYSGIQVYLKLDNLQPPGSFKLRGISHLIQKALETGRCDHVYCASGGNAGMAAAYASRELGIPCTIILPKTTPAFLADRLKLYNAEVRVHGEVYDEAKTLAQELSKQTGSLYVPAFEHPDIWEGHASMIVEAAQQMQERPSVVITSVGGGGLCNGIVQGMRQVGWENVPIVAVETQGADCFDAAIKAGEVVNLEAITSVAKTLGSLSVSPTTLEYYKQANPPIINYVVTDQDAVSACVKFADDHRFLVEPACGASLAIIYGKILHRLIEEKKLTSITSALVIVCGGAIVSTEVIQSWKKDFHL
ncbi:L-serine dehydratase/L-threonine deaminase-like isoform X2 [Biomphalaria glabrata]|uniref:L-serine ammonia-lyase n=1 Tax=Biomphalaria glabrata TaxID=6526 RepID=A0A9W2YGK4_BIOGL|nr:L-serine dehydratase/L-threonine deaminase-like isoform X2 [Biomphalaria glabrata]